MRRFLPLVLFFSFLFWAGPSYPESQTVQWFEWGPNAFELAKKEEKPILLNLTASWCHWCHVMERETYTDPAVIQLINRFFIPVRVDSDLRPDVNERYNMGGWPSTVFLTAEGNVLVGSTYLSAEQMKQSLAQIEKLHREKRIEIDSTAQKNLAEFEMLLEKELNVSKEEDLAPSFIDKISARLLLESDDEFGGVGKQEKNPIPEVTEFLFLLGEVRPDPKTSQLLTRFLDGLKKLHDPETGGFYRYAAARNWTDPQYEKMLSVNAFLLRDFTWGHALLGRADDRALVTSMLQYLRDYLWDKALGGFFGSQDADLLIETMGLDEKEEAARIPGKVYYAYPKSKREALGLPPVDHHVYTDSCAQMVTSLIEVAKKMSDEKAADMALRALDFLMEVSFEAGKGMKHTFPQTHETQQLLKDQVWMLKALFEAYEFTQDEKYLKGFGELLPAVEREFGNEKGIFYDMTRGANALGNLAKREIPLVENCLMARIYLGLYRLTGEARYQKRAQAILYFFAPRFQQFSVYSAAYGSALIEWFYPQLEVKVVGSRQDRKAKDFCAAAQKLPAIRMRVVWLDTADSKSLPQVILSVKEKSLTPASSADELPLLFEVARKIIQKGSIQKGSSLET